MDLAKAIDDPRINVFDITHDKTSNFGIQVHTYKKPGESEDEFYERDNRNFEKALQLKNNSKR